MVKLSPDVLSRLKLLVAVAAEVVGAASEVVAAEVSEVAEGAPLEVEVVDTAVVLVSFGFIVC